MSTLISTYNSDGCVGRCDLRCYNAVTLRCVCVCGGVNHGVGLKQAIANTQKLAIEQIRENHPGSAGVLKVRKFEFQGTLF